MTGLKPPDPIPELVRESDVTPECVRAILATAFNTELAEEGRFYVHDDGVSILFLVDAGHQTISMLSGWPFKPRFTEGEKLVFVKRLNDKFYLGRFAMPDPSGFWCDHHLCYTGGLIPAQLIGAVTRLLVNCHHVLPEDTANMLGTE